MKLAIHRPGLPLSQHVEFLWMIRDAPAHALERIVPTGTLELVVNLHEDEIRIHDDAGRVTQRLDGAAVAGVYRRYFVIDTREHVSMIGAHFRPAGAGAVLGVPAGVLADRHVALADLWGASTLREQLCCARDPFHVLECALVERMTQRDRHAAIRSGAPDPRLQRDRGSVSRGARARERRCEAAPRRSRRVTFVQSGRAESGHALPMRTILLILALGACMTNSKIHRPSTTSAVVRYQVTDVGRAIAFYTERLDFELVQRAGDVFATVMRGDLHLLLSGPASSGSRPMADGQAQRPGGWNRIVLYVDDLASVVTRLRGHVTFRNEVEAGPGGTQIQLEDPDGNPIELHEPPRS